MSLRVGIVCPEERSRMTAARAFDAAPADWEISFSAQPDHDADVLVGFGVSVPGALAMDPADPEGIIDRIREHRSQSRRLIVVVGASGGCGATSVALHLAAACRETRAAVVDLQPDRSAALRLGIADDVPAGIDAGSVVLPVSGGFRLVFPRDDAADPNELVETAFQHADKVIVDASAETLPCLQTPVNHVVLLMTPTIPSATKAARLLADEPERSWVPVTNRTGPGSDTTRHGIERVLRRRVALELPCSPGLRDAEDELKLLTSPLSLWRMRIQRLGDAL